MLRRRALLSTLPLPLIGACASKPATEPAAKAIVWPLPPDPPRYLYEGTLRNAASLVDRSSLDMRLALTGEDLSKSSFSKPLGVAAGRGRIYVTDTEGRRIFVFDVPRRRTFAFGHRGDGELRKPIGVAVDEAGHVYVVDGTQRRVLVFDTLGLYLRELGPHPAWVRPTNVAASPGGDRVYVVDTGGVESESHRVFVYDGEGRFIDIVGRRGAGPGEFNLPTDAAVDAAGGLWVLDAGNFRVQALDRDGHFRHAFGSVGNGLGQFARPRGLAVDRHGAVYVSDAAFCNVQVFMPDGHLLLAIGGRAESDRPGRYGLPAKVAVDETDRLYIVDQYLHKVEIVRRLRDDESERLARPAGA